MAFPSTVRTTLRSGIPGELSHDGPTRAIAATINTTTQANNVFGRVFTYTDKAQEVVSAGGTGTFAGILINPKAYGLNENGTVNNFTSAEFLQMGEVYVQLTTTGAVIGDPLYYVDATGAIGHGAPATGQTAIPNAVVVRHNASPETPTLAVIRLTN